MWVGLLVVAPVVIAAALSVRRGEARLQALSMSLTSEIGIAEVVPAALPVTGEWRLERDASGNHLVLLGGPAWFSMARVSEVLLYWSQQPSPEVAALAESDWPSTDEDWTRRFEMLDAAALPADAILLGAWTDHQRQAFIVPEAIAERQGALIWFDVEDTCLAYVANVSQVVAAPR
jgi:hypothetical protein